MKNVPQSLVIGGIAPHLRFKTFDQPFGLQQLDNMCIGCGGAGGAGMPGLFDDMLDIFGMGSTSNMAPETRAHRQSLFNMKVDSIMRYGPLFGEGGFHRRAVRSFDLYPVAIRSFGDADDHMPEIEADIIDDKREQWDYAALEYGYSNSFSAQSRHGVSWMSQGARRQ